MSGGSQDRAHQAVYEAASKAFREYTGTREGEPMWNLNMETTWQIIAPAVVAALDSPAAQLRREQAAIDAHHARKASRRLHWVWSLGHRKPWRSPGPVPWRHLPSLFEWVRNAHDCSDASLMCSCAGSPRFPRRVEAL